MVVNTFDTSVITIKKYCTSQRLNSPSFTSPRFIKNSWTSSSDGAYSVFSDNDDQDDNIQGLVLSTSCSGSLSDADIDDNISVDDRSLNSEVRDYGPIDVDTCRKASNKDKMKKQVEEVNFFEYTSTKKKGSSGRHRSFIKKELSSLKALSTKTRLSLSRGSSTDTDSSGSQSDSVGCFA